MSRRSHWIDAEAGERRAAKPLSDEDMRPGEGNTAGVQGRSKLTLRIMLAALVFVAFAVLLAAAETAVRIRQWVKYGAAFGIEDTYTVDPVSGLRVPVPGTSFGPIHINSLGFRGPEIIVPKPASTLRVAFLGSSTTYCAEVSKIEASWPHLVTKALQDKWPGATVDYVNAGVPGFTVKSTLRNLQLRVAPLQPDVIVIYEGHNDLSRNSFELAVKEGLISKRLEQELMWPSKYSLLWYLVEKNLRILQQQRAANTGLKLRFDRETLVAPFRRDLIDLVRTGQQVADLVVVVTLSNRLRPDQTAEQQVRASVTHLYFMPYMSTDSLIEAYAAYNDQVRQVAEDSGALLVSEENFILPDGDEFVDSIHFTDKGSSAMANRVIRALLTSDRLRQLISSKLSYRSIEPYNNLLSPSIEADWVASIHQASIDRSISKTPIPRGGSRLRTQ